jgi:rare lipoprotein A (peptidoglycan hydrolase)
LARIFNRFFRDERELLSKLPPSVRLLIKYAAGLFLAWLVGGLILGGLFLSIAKGETVTMIGLASWYGGGEKLNKYTASGEVFDPGGLTCAIWDVPFGTYLKVTNVRNGYSILVKVNDRGPAKRLGRLIDLTWRAFSEIAPLKEGIIRVKVEVYDPGYGGN